MDRSVSGGLWPRLVLLLRPRQPADHAHPELLDDGLPVVHLRDDALPLLHVPKVSHRLPVHVCREEGLAAEVRQCHRHVGRRNDPYVEIFQFTIGAGKNNSITIKYATMACHKVTSISITSFFF